MNLTKKNIQKTSGIHKRYKMELPVGLMIKPISKHKG